MPVDVYVLSPVLDAAAAQALAPALLERRGGDLWLDGSQVDKIGALSLQVLLSAQKTWAHDAHAFSLADASPPLATALRQFGASSLLDSSAPAGDPA